MSDSVYQRRQPPSPLVFSPEAVLSPPNTQRSTASSHGSGSNTVSMPFVRRHVTRRLKAAKAECDKELQRVTNNITTFFEERLREADYEIERDLRDRDRGRDRYRTSLTPDSEQLPDTLNLRGSEMGSALQTDEYSSDGGYEAEVEYGQHNRQRAYLAHEKDPRPPTLSHRASSPGLNVASAGSSMSPGTLRRQSTTPWDRPLSSSMSSSAIASSPASSTILLPETSLTRKPTNPTSSSSSWSTGGPPSRRLSRSIHIAPRPTRSGQSSRSTSRSRSPLPPLSTHTNFSEFIGTGPASANRRTSRILVDDPVDPIMTALYDIIAVATDVTEMSIAQLTSQPKVCASLVQRVQNIGKAWDEHPDWHGRNWYVQVLLAIASLSRVVEWWEAEKQFWNFDDNEDEDEPLMFVTKAADDSPLMPRQSDQELEGFRLNPDDVPGRPSQLDSHIRRLRGEEQRKLTVSPSRDILDNAATTLTHKDHESARVLATERLRLQAETAHNQNIVVELSLDGDHFIWVNHAWRVVVGTDPDSLAGTRISNLLAPSDWGVFKDATQRLREDDSHTIEVRFRLQVESNMEREPNPGFLFQQMEGKGMLMVDREDGQPSHTMWVVKPIAPPRYGHDSLQLDLATGDLAPGTASSSVPTFSGHEPTTPFNFVRPIMVDPILCRICECQIPQWYFEKHSETCAETHRLEAEITECNESISELRNTIRDLIVAVDRSSPNTAPEYRGMPIFTPAASPIVSSPLQLFRANRMQRFGVKKFQKQLLNQLDDILQVAGEIAVPASKEEEAKEPIERQRLLSPSSERKISQIRTWSKPTTDDPALGQLIQDAERVMRQKADNVVRMQNTLRYAEKIWREWEERVGEVLDPVAETDNSDSDSGSEARRGGETEVDDPSRTPSEYGLAGEASSGPTPLGSSSPAPSPTPVTLRPNLVSIPSAPIPILGPRQSLHTRAPTPSSVSSPLALAAPIVAPSSPELPHMALDDGASSYIKAQKSVQNFVEFKSTGTPPASPLLPARDGPTLTREPSMKRSHRRHSTINPIMSPPGPLSPRQSSSGPLARTTPTSIKDFDVIKPISKGAFGSVFLAKKKATGDYYAIKVLKKADMIAKNQITNVKAERMILMKQAESPFVAKLYFTFQSKDNLYLVMEYLNGGDCAALIKSLGCLPEEWTKNYIAEVVLGLEYLHQRGVVHRDLKPDNLLIDQHGHLKLTDFGLSRIGLLGRQTRQTQTGRQITRYSSRSRPPSIDSAYLSSPMINSDGSAGNSYFPQRTQSITRTNSSPHLVPADDVESSGSESLSGLHSRRSVKANDSPLQSFATELTNDLRSYYVPGGTPPGDQKFVGTPDYLAPETILGLRGDDAAVDWWALGVITYEFLYGIPPFHADTPEKVFENILSGHIEWHEDWIDFTDEARDFMKSLMTVEPSERLGSNGADEVKAHPFFEGIEWNQVTTMEAAFIPQISDPESTDYFDPRGAIPQLFQDDEPVAITGQASLDSPISGSAAFPSVSVPVSLKETTSPPGSDDFGSFSFKNLPVLKQANDDVIRKLKTDQMVPLTQSLSEPPPLSIHQRKRSVSQRVKKPPSVVTTVEPKTMPTNPPSPSTSVSSVASSPSRMSLPPPTPGSSSNHSRKPSEYGAVERFRLSQKEGNDRRNSTSSRLRTASVSSTGDGSGSEAWNSSNGHGSHASHGSHGSGSRGSPHDWGTPPSSVHSIDLRRGPDPNDRVVTCLLAEDNPITAKIIETLLIRLGCRCVVVADGSEAISVAMGDIKFDCILMDLQMPVLDGEGAARYIRSTNSKNTNTPIIAVSAYNGADLNEGNSVFTASLSKPLQKADLLAVMRQLGFKTSVIHGPGATKITTAQVNP